MNIKIRATEVACFVPGDYNQVYQALQRQLESPLKDLFAERTVGNDYLQWELPGEGWQALADSDPVMGDVARQELSRQQQLVMDRFGKNREMVRIVLSVPDDGFVFYKYDENGQLMIRLTAWGYRHPVVIGGGAATGKIGALRPVITETPTQEEPIQMEDVVQNDEPVQEEVLAPKEETVQIDEPAQEEVPVVVESVKEEVPVIAETPVQEETPAEAVRQEPSKPSTTNMFLQLLLMLLVLAALVVATYFGCKEILS